MRVCEVDLKVCVVTILEDDAVSPLEVVEHLGAVVRRQRRASGESLFEAIVSLMRCTV